MTAPNMTLREVLKRKFGTPKNVLRALQLPESLLDIRGMALDGAMPMTSKVMLEKLLAQHLSGHELQQARDLLNSIDPDDGERTDPFEEGAVDEEEDDVDEEALREQRRRAMAKTAAFLSTKKGLDEEQIFEALKDFPTNGLSNLGKRAARDLDDLMKDRRRRMAGDSKRLAFATDRAETSLRRMFPEAERLFAGTAVEAGIGEAPEPLAMDSAAQDSFDAMYPNSKRIGVA